MNFTVDLRASVTEIVIADTVKEAMDKAQALHPGYQLEYVHNNDTGEGTECNHCNGCGNVIMEDEQTSTDLDGGEYCQECTQAVEEDMRLHPEEYKQDEEEE